MYRQILVAPIDLNFQRILWSEDESLPIREYQLVTVTYGTAAAPFLALRVIKQLLQDEGQAFPLAVPILRDNIYVDDVLFGADDIPLLRQSRDQVRSLLRLGHFNLRKWSSNSSALLQDIDPEDHGLACTKDLQPDETLKILGVRWSPCHDAFQFHVSIPTSVAQTKRSILSVVARIFDPLGWGVPVTITAKIFLQTLWRTKIDWDDILPATLISQWIDIVASLEGLQGLSLNRWVGLGSDSLTCELHGFADASASAYAAAVYVRVVSVSGDTAVSLLLGKSKVAPVRVLSIPRLELAAAALLARLLEFARDSLNLTTAPCWCWTDSTIVLAWLSQHPARWKTFVANRVSDIQSRIPTARWQHVPTQDNPADCASRGLLGRDLASHHLWWHGPAWLRLDASQWPLKTPVPGTTLEENSRIVTHGNVPSNTWDLATRYSSWPKLLRVTAYVLRFTSKLRRSYEESERQGPDFRALTSAECRRARVFWLKKVQSEVFPRETKALLLNQALSQKSPLCSLHPFLDENKIVRVGGRLKNAPLPFNARHPIILATHPVITMLIRHTHLRSLHAGPQLTLTTLRQDYWVLRARSLVRAIIHGCVACTRERAATPTQLMGDLPRVRVTPAARAFLHCGLDYAGPVLVRPLSGRGIASRKAYIAIFICMATRAVHLELVEGYSTDAFLAAFTRFCSRRGLPESVYSDNGTTFIGADRELKRAFREALRNPDFQNRTACDGVAWKFIPPSAPHFGGLWEAGVRSVKHHIRRVLGTHTLTFEEFTTLLCGVEACLNSRPLGPLSDSLNDYETLTPGHFLTGNAITAIPNPSTLSINENRLSRWHLVRQMSERFWRIWVDDYVNTLQQRVKWRKIESESVKVGRLVLIRNPGLPPCKWELGRVQTCHTGADGLTRVVTIRTAHSELVRPLSKLCLLPIDMEKSNADASG